MSMPLNPFEKVIFDHHPHFALWDDPDSTEPPHHQLTCTCTFEAQALVSDSAPMERLRRVHAQHVFGQLRQLFTPTWG